MSKAPKGPAQCFNCGCDVDPSSWDEDPNGRPVFLCSQRECHRELQSMHQGAYEEALDDFNESWGRS